ncbi:MAG: RND transporter [Candidatus Rokuibacteriota bacterium]|nr:MAG: RND transporter [Candidatus Rokubacteria bacterium]
MRRYVEGVLRFRLLVIGLALLVSGILGFQIRNLRVVVDPNATLPQKHPYVSATRDAERLFRLKHQVLIGITSRAGDAFDPAVLRKVQQVTSSLVELPGVERGSVFSLARRAKNIIGTADGLEVLPLMDSVPQGEPEIAAMRQAVHNNPVYIDAVISRDARTAAVLADFATDPAGFQGIVGKVKPIVERARDASVEVTMGGRPVFLAELERYSERAQLLFPLAIVVVGLIHYEAFRTLQGLILPLVTALLAVIWGLGAMGLFKTPMDAFNVTTPILIFAVAAGHAVQILKRYYEEYHRLARSGTMPASAASRQAVVESLTRVGPVMLAAGIVAGLGFLSLVVFEVATIRTFGVFTALGIFSALVLELTFIPALRSLLPPPGPRESRRESEHRIWDRLTETIADWVLGPRRRRVYAVVTVLLVIWAVAASRVAVDTPLRSYFFESLAFQRDDRILNERLGGTNRLYVLIEGDEEGAIKEPRVLSAMEATQRFLEAQPHVGKTLSLADFIRRMNRAMHADDPGYDRIPESRDLVAQYLLAYSLSGDLEDLESYVDDRYRAANILVLLKTDSTAYTQELISKLSAVLPGKFGARIKVRFGGDLAETAALTETIVNEKLLNIIQISAVILVITSLVFRSLTAGVLVLVPLAVAVLANFGLMGLLGIRLNIATSVISAMAVGLGADYAIYLVYRLREELRQGRDEAVAVRVALTTAGKATLFVASAVAGGYGLLALSWGFNIHIWFAILIVSAMLTSCLAALTLLPSLILTFRPRFIFREASNNQELTDMSRDDLAASHRDP